MRTLFSYRVLIVATAVFFSVGWNASAQGAAADSQGGVKVSPEQKVQLQRLSQLEEQLQKSREALHAAINEFGWESDEADAAREKLFADRAEYRKLRRSLRASGVAVPPPSGFGAGSPGSRPGPGGPRWQARHHGYRHGGPCHCDCGGW